MAKAEKAEERARRKAICSGNATAIRGRAAPSPDTAVSCSIAFVSAFLGKLCVHTLGAPSGSAAGVDNCRGAGAGVTIWVGAKISA